MSPVSISSISDLSASEKVQLAQDLWDDIAIDPSIVPVHDWQKLELEQRKARLMLNPASALSWDEIQRRIRKRHRR